MKPWFFAMILVFIQLVPGLGSSGEIIIDPAGKPSCVDKNGNVICLHYFEKEKIQINQFVNGLCDDLMVRLIQPGSRLYAEVGEPLILEAGFCQKKESFSLELPQVKSMVEFNLQIFTKKPDQSWAQLKSFPLILYPDDLMKPLKTWAEKNLLLIKGDSENLISFLDKEEIPHSTRNIRSSGDRVILHVGDIKKNVPDYMNADNKIIFFKETVVDLPQIRGISTRYGPRIFVEIKLIDSLSESPPAQRSFMKIFRMALDLDSNFGG
jgi:hypothetical protein